MSYLVTEADLLGEGLPTDARTLQLCDVAEAVIERHTAFRFREFGAAFQLDGNGSEILVLPQPVLTITSIVEGVTPLAGGQYIVLSRRPPEDDERRWPRLARIGGSWAVGWRNVIVTGVFGFTDRVNDLEVPPAEIKRVALHLVALELARVGVYDEVVVRKIRAYASSVSADGLSASLSALAVTDGPTGVPEIDKVLAAFRHRSKR